MSSILSYLCVIRHAVRLAQWLEYKIQSVMVTGSNLTCVNIFFSYVVSMSSLCRLYDVYIKLFVFYSTLCMSSSVVRASDLKCHGHRFESHL